MPVFPRLEKDPEGVYIFTMDWSSWLDGYGLSSLDSIVVTVEDGLTKDNVSTTSTDATITVSGGSAGKEYTVKGIATAGTRVDVRRIVVSVKLR